MSNFEFINRSKYQILDSFFQHGNRKNINQTQKSDKPRTWLLFQYGEDQ